MSIAQGIKTLGVGFVAASLVACSSVPAGDGTFANEILLRQKDGSLVVTKEGLPVKVGYVVNQGSITSPNVTGLAARPTGDLTTETIIPVTADSSLRQYAGSAAQLLGAAGTAAVGAGVVQMGIAARNSSVADLRNADSNRKNADTNRQMVGVERDNAYANNVAAGAAETSANAQQKMVDVAKDNAYAANVEAGASETMANAAQKGLLGTHIGPVNISNKFLQFGGGHHGPHYSPK